MGRLGFILALCLLALTGCAGYRLQGVVIEGKTPAIFLVDKDDSRLTQPGLANAVVQVTIDPHEMSPKTLAPVSSDDRGRFEAVVGEPGAGLLEYQASILCRLTGYQAATQEMPLPPSDKRLLIVLVPGADTYRPPPDILNETLEMKRQLESR